MNQDINPHPTDAQTPQNAHPETQPGEAAPKEQQAPAVPATGDPTASPGTGAIGGGTVPAAGSAPIGPIQQKEIPTQKA